MRCGLYGKLPSKRDFVAVSMPQGFLRVWEPWLQGGLSASRVDLGNAWQQAFLRAPIWRFWLGSEICRGVTTTGAFMPSVDGVGRYFPLTVFAAAEHPEAIPPPELDPQEVWYSKAEEFLLSALEQDATFEAVSQSLSELEPPLSHPASPPGSGVFRLADGTMVAVAAGSTLPGVLAAIRAEDYARAYATASFWWTIGGEGFPPLVLVGYRMPDPYVFTGLLTGRLDGVPG